MSSNRKFGPALTLDLETTIVTSFKRKANAFDPANYVVYAGWKVGKDNKPQMQRFARPGPPPGWFANLLREHWPVMILGVNIKFDILHLLKHKDDLEAFMEWVAAGGNLWDSQLVEYLLNGMTKENHMLSMDEMAPRYGGNIKFDEVKELWQAGVCTSDIDPDLIRRYLIGDGQSEGDIGNTRIIFDGQYQRAVAAGQVKSILMNNGSLLCTIEMERNGMAVDLLRGRELAAGLEVELAHLVHELVGFLPDDLPFDFNWGSPAQKSALIFGGEVKYDKWAPHLTDDGKMQYAMKEEIHYLLEDGGTMEVSWWEHCRDTEWAVDPSAAKWPVTFSGGKNKGEYKTKKVKVPNLDKPKGAIKPHYYSFPGYTKPEKRWATSTPGQYSTGADIIEALGNRDIPFLKALAKRTSMAKDLTTYYITVNDKGEEVGMLTLVQADGIIHHMLNHTSTVTGRFSSSNPNLQNLPKGNKSDVKTIFISRFKGGKVIQSDFSSLEVYVQAILTRCQQLIDDLKAGLDMHCVRVSQTEGIEYEEAVRRCKGYKDADGNIVDPIKEWEYKRTKAKIFSFQRAYGAGAGLIAVSTGMEKEEVDALIAAEEARYPEITEFNDTLIKGLEASCWSLSPPRFVQHPEIQGLTVELREATWRAPDNKLYTWRQSPAPEWLVKMPASRGGCTSSFSPTEVKNYPVQGTGGEWAKAAMWLAIRAFYERKNWNGLGLLVNQVHDACYADADPTVAYDVAVVLHACMEEASTFMEWYFDWQVPVPVPSDTTWGANMGEEGRMPDTFKADVAIARKDIRNKYIGGYTPSFEREPI